MKDGIIGIPARVAPRFQDVLFPLDSHRFLLKAEGADLCTCEVVLNVVVQPFLVSFVLAVAVLC